jgi:hypothetical protein
MRTKVQGLSQTAKPDSFVEGSYRARVDRMGPAGHAAKPCLAATFEILEPVTFAGRFIRTRLYCHARALWKLRWFLHAFNYNADLLAAEEVDDRGWWDWKGSFAWPTGTTMATVGWMRYHPARHIQLEVPITYLLGGTMNMPCLH